MTVGPLDCPRCRTIHEPGTRQCSCGYDFVKKAGGEWIWWAKWEGRLFWVLAFIGCLIGQATLGVGGAIGGTLAGLFAAMLLWVLRRMLTKSGVP